MAQTILDRRASGVLLHPTSLASPHGIGDLGQEARSFVDFLARTRQRWWQTLPLTPPSGGASPYNAVSAFGGNPLLIDLRELAELGLLSAEDLEGAVAPATAKVDFGEVTQKKLPLLAKAFSAFGAKASAELRKEYVYYLEAQRSWLDDHALFLALHASTEGAQTWLDWPQELRDRKKSALEKARKDLGHEIAQHAFTQFLFDRQWAALRKYAHARGVFMMGDLPIFVSHDSAEVWAHREVFKLGKDGRPKVVAGVPPDYFAKDGQLWGNPLYDWEELRERRYDWWVARFANALYRFDAVRVDHFIGFHRAWHVPAGAASAKEGKYVPGPRAHFFERLEKELGALPIVAEDLGAVTPAVWKLRDQFGFPGMRVLQFAFGDAEKGSEHLPHEHTPASVAYTGTHDNDTITGWYRAQERAASAGDGAARACLEHLWRYLGNRPDKIHWAMIHLLMMSPANLAIVPAQDLLGLGSEARMNVPGVADGNWGWRMLPGALDPEEIGRILYEHTTVFGRAGISRPALPSEAPEG